MTDGPSFDWSRIPALCQMLDKTWEILIESPGAEKDACSMHSGIMIYIQSGPYVCRRCCSLQAEWRQPACSRKYLMNNGDSAHYSVSCQTIGGLGYVRRCTSRQSQAHVLVESQDISPKDHVKLRSGQRAYGQALGWRCCFHWG